MYDNGYNGNGGNRYRSRGSAPSSVNFRGFEIKPLYMYIAGGILLLLVIYLMVQFWQTSLVMHFSAAAGVLLLLANVRELIGKSYGQHYSTAMLNTMIGGALIFAWLTQLLGVLGWILWLPALALLVVAAPLAVGRASVYRAYLQTARGAAENVRRAVGRRI
jgi:hypothetical protein